MASETIFLPLNYTPNIPTAGVEPAFHEPKSCVLPLDDDGIRTRNAI